MFYLTWQKCIPSIISDIERISQLYSQPPTNSITIRLIAAVIGSFQNEEKISNKRVGSKLTKEGLQFLFRGFSSWKNGPIIRRPPQVNRRCQTDFVTESRTKICPFTRSSDWVVSASLNYACDSRTSPLETGFWGFVDWGKMVVLRLVAAAKFQIQKFHSHAHPIPASFLREANQVADGLAKESTKLIL
ncbi:uncharacterized protein LOC125849200 [Solanum stenotomum]|uniref:uncharacterized protein LOC125849200 n=1 Tax=Solanum stenotomum TaxID=172797 RepID=UPI0020D07F31|nr:uncharacterized protein LOC125849200 [Solanum stenotomum]